MQLCRSSQPSDFPLVQTPPFTTLPLLAACVSLRWSAGAPQPAGLPVVTSGYPPCRQRLQCSPPPHPRCSYPLLKEQPHHQLPGWTEKLQEGGSLSTGRWRETGKSWARQFMSRHGVSQSSKTVCSPLIFLHQQRSVCLISGDVGPKVQSLHSDQRIQTLPTPPPHRPTPPFNHSKNQSPYSRLRCPKRSPFLHNLLKDSVLKRADSRCFLSRASHFGFRFSGFCQR